MASQVSKTVWLWVSTVSVWVSHRATAHDGPIEPCIRYGFR